MLTVPDKRDHGLSFRAGSTRLPTLDALYEQLVIARKQLDQRRCAEVLEGMLSVQPVNPILSYSLAEVYASLGPEFDAKKAIACLDDFLQLTDPSVLGAPGDRLPAVMTADDITRDLRRFQLAEPRSNLEAQRIAAIEMRESLDTKKPDAYLLAPDGGQMKRELRNQSRKLDDAEREHDKIQAQREGNLRKFRELERMRPSADVVMKLRSFSAAINRQGNTIANLQKQIAVWKPQVERMEQLLGR